MDKRQDEGFTIQLAMVDMIPVIFFLIATIVIYDRTGLITFLFGGIICTAAGLGKVAWKVVLALWKKDVRFLFLQLRYLMPTGFLMMVLALVINRQAEAVTSFIHNVIAFPSLLFLILGFGGCVGMGVCAGKLDPDRSRSNWIEQGVNCLAQAAFLVAIILAVR